MDISRDVAQEIVDIWETDQRKDYGGYVEEPEEAY